MRTPTLALLALAPLLACSRPQPSPDYESARRIWTDLVQQHGEAAAEDPRADEVLSLLDRVPGDSLDGAAAGELRGRIQAARRAAEEERARRARLVEGAGALPALAAGAGDREPEPRPPAPRPGLKLEEFREKYGDCFEERGPVQILGGEGREEGAGEMWALNDDPGCREKHGQLVGQVVLFSKGALTALAPEGKVGRKEVLQEVELGRLPDGSVGMRVDGGVVPLPPGARLVTPDGGSP